MHIADAVADSDDFGDALVPDGMPRRHREYAPGDADVQITAGDGHRSH